MRITGVFIKLWLDVKHSTINRYFAFVVMRFFICHNFINNVPLVPIRKSHMIDKEIIIENFIKNFVLKDRRERALFELVNKRFLFSGRLNHSWFRVFDMKFLEQVKREDDYPDKIKELLKFKDNQLCYVISTYEEYDDKLLPFGNVFNEIYSRGASTVILNTSADTFFLDTEQQQGPAPRFIGRRNPY
jgi:hypothetical protein